MQYRPRNFKIQELVPKEMYDNYSEWKLWLMFDDRILKAADVLRNKYGVMICNDWLWGGKSHYRGFRPMDYDDGLSQHKFGRALDLLPVEYPVLLMREDLKSIKQLRSLITRFEGNETPHLHIDCALPDSEGVVRFYA